MTDITSQFAFSEDKKSGYQRLLASITRGINAYGESRSRRGQIEFLEAKSDAELAEMGLKRENIAFHVFRDRFYI